MEDFCDLLNLQRGWEGEKKIYVYVCVCVVCVCGVCGVCVACGVVCVACVCGVCYNPKPLRIEHLGISPAVISEMQVILRNGNKTAFLYWYSIDHSVLVAPSCHPALSEWTCVLATQQHSTV